MKTELWSILLVMISTSIGSFGPLYLKKASNTLSLNFKKIITNRDLIIGVSFYAFSTILFIPALSGGELSVLYPIVALVYIWVSLLSVRVLGEKMNTLKWTGITLILIGVTLIGFTGST